MATQINDRTLRIISSSYSSLFPPRNSPEKPNDKKIKIPDKQTLERIHKQIFSGGVRAPTLADINTGYSRYPSRQSNMESPLRYQLKIHSKHIGGSKTTIQNLEMERSNMSLGSLGSYPKMVKFLLPNGCTKSSEGESSFENDAEKDEWEKWRDSVAGVRDARDVLYRYSVSKDREIRYNSSTLPHIPKENRPWTAGEETQPKVRKNNLVLDFSKESKSDKTQHVPQPHRQAALSRTLRRKFLKSRDSQHEVNFLEVKRITANQDLTKGEYGQCTTNVQQPIEFHGIGFTRNRMERPLKHENLYGRPMYLSYKHYEQVPAIPVVTSTKEYKSVDAYKQYVENLQNNVIVEGQKPGLREREKSDLSQYGQENRILQSVINVNQPAEPIDLQESNDVKPIAENDAENQTNRSNLSINRNEDAHTNRSNKSIVVEIKSTWRERENTDEHNIQEQGEPVMDALQPQGEEGADNDPHSPKT
ncbi:uncharacterized protein LOC134245764 [Saccostrea cucullata]|uniref:uncharacterized protein LOC134245764 n=1 Tax=Saccostrea cuccullata TaxID=36930 RepID=UPI002ED29D00